MPGPGDGSQGDPPIAHPAPGTMVREEEPAHGGRTAHGCGAAERHSPPEPPDRHPGTERPALEPPITAAPDNELMRGSRSGK
jgi:hypothetical protein